MQSYWRDSNITSDSGKTSLMYKISVSPTAWVRKISLYHCVRVVPKTYNNVRSIHALVKCQCIKVLTPPPPLPPLGSANISTTELTCDLLGKLNNFIFPSTFFNFLTAVYSRHTGSIECANGLSLLYASEDIFQVITC